MLSERKSRRLVEFVLQKFESDYKGQWEQERFTVFPHPCKTKLGELDFDTIFFWKVYAQGYFAMRAGDFFKTLAEQMGNGPAMIRHLASLAPNRNKLLATYRDGQFDPGMNKAINAGRPGWRVLGYAVTSSVYLVKRYPAESQSYIAQWLCDCALNRRWNGSWHSLVESLNSSVVRSLSSKDIHERVSQVTEFIVNTFVLVPERHLTGVGPEMLSFFFRDWRDFTGYYWKHDTRNEAFWRIVASRPQLELNDGRKDTVLAFLVHNLSSDELESGALAKINTTVYRIHKDLGDAAVQEILSRICRI